MSKRQAGPNENGPKRDGDHLDDDASSKRRKTAGEKERDENESPAEPLKLTDLIDHCLLEIFNRLSLNDLLNIADSNKRLKQLAEMVLKRKYLEEKPTHSFKNLKIENVDGGSSRMSKVNEYDLTITDLKTCLQLLRCFGNQFREVTLDYKNVPSKFSEKIEQYLAKYCSNTLSELKLFNARSSNPFDCCKEFFIAIRNVYLEHCYFIGSRSFDNIFPNVSSLYLTSISIENPKIIAATYLRLQSLSVGNMNEMIVRELIRLNPQIKSLAFTSAGYAPALIQFANEHLPKLACLSLGNLSPAFYDESSEAIHLNNITSFYLHPTIWGAISSISFSFDKLESFYVSDFGLNQRTFDSLAKIKTLRKLNLISSKNGEKSIEQLFELDNILSSVEQMYLYHKLQIVTKTSEKSSSGRVLTA